LVRVLILIDGIVEVLAMQKVVVEVHVLVCWWGAPVCRAALLGVIRIDASVHDGFLIFRTPCSGWWALKGEKKVLLMLELKLILVLGLPAWDEAVSVVSVVEADVSCCLSNTA